MNCYDEQLRQLQAQCARKKKLVASIEELRVQREAYAARAQELQQIMADPVCVLLQCHREDG